jgi:hypothetical protein
MIIALSWLVDYYRGFFNPGGPSPSNHILPILFTFFGQPKLEEARLHQMGCA